MIQAVSNKSIIFNHRSASCALTHLLAHCNVAPAEQQPYPNLEPRVALAEGDRRLYLRNRLLMHACTLEQLGQEEPSGELEESEVYVVVEERCAGLRAVTEKCVQLKGAGRSNQRSKVLLGVIVVGR